MTDDKVRQIQEVFDLTDKTVPELAKHFGLSQVTIKAALARQVVSSWEV